IFSTIIPRPLPRIAQTLVRLSNLLELLRRGLIAGVLVRVMHNRELPVRLLDFVFRGILLNPEKLVVILAFRFLEFELRVVDVLFDTRFLRVGFVDGFIFADGIFPGAGFAEGAGAGFAGFKVAGVEG
ncbi:MAG: hypothetical protein Q9225_003467, partial [Loekoesia sp. 1 TL-2023]